MIHFAVLAMTVPSMLLQSQAGSSPVQAGPSADELIAVMLQSLPGEGWRWTDVTEWTGEFCFTETEPAAALNMTVSETLGPDSSYRSLVFRDVDLSQDCLFVEETGTGRLFALEWPQRLRWRPVSDFVWVSYRLLVFSQWSQPDFGYRYAVDVQEQRLVLALALSGD